MTLTVLALLAPRPSASAPYDLWDYQPTIIGDAKTVGMWGTAIEHVPDANHDPSLHVTEYFPAHGALLREGVRGKLLLWRNHFNDLMFLYDLNQPVQVLYRTDPVVSEKSIVLLRNGLRRP